MANTDNIISFIADGAITEYALVSTTTAGKVTVTTAASDARCIGVAQRACNDGDSVEVVISGRTRVIAGATIASNKSLVMAITAGKVDAQDATSGNYAIGSILPNINQVSSVSGDQILINFTGPKLLVP